MDMDASNSSEDDVTVHVSKKPRLENSEDESASVPQKCPFAKDVELPEKVVNRVEEPGSLVDDMDIRVFHLLDEVDGDEEDGTGSGCDESASQDSSDLDLNDDDLENMLDEPLPDELKKPRPQLYEEKFKTVLEEKGRNHFDVLPEGWLQVTHNSGIPLYLHKTARVCTVSRPYFLGPGSVRKHEIPVSSIPCLSYRRALEKEEEDRQKFGFGQPLTNSADNSNQEPSTTTTTTSADSTTNSTSNAASDADNVHKSSSQNGSNEESADDKPPATSSSSTETPKTNAPSNTLAEAVAREPMLAALHNGKIETVTENLKSQSLSAEQVQEYCQKLFHFKQVRVKRFKSWAARRKFTSSRKKIKNLQRPTLPNGTKLITVPIIATDANGNRNNKRTAKQWIMNPNGKSYICILHEYVQRALKKQPLYEFKELENAATPYSASVRINGLQYGTGFGTSKKQAKSEAARETLEILLPEMRDKITSAKSGSTSKVTDLSVFDEIKIEDPRVMEFCAKTTEPTPHALLLTCLQRNFGMGDVKVEYKVNTVKHKQNEFTMTVGKHTATVACKNKRDGKQFASQAILQILHPHIKTWGSLQRLYGNQSIKSFKKKKLEEQEITVLQNKATVHEPNYAILDKLKLEMTKLGETRAAIKPIGTFIPPSDIDLPTGSASNLNNVEL